MHRGSNKAKRQCNVVKNMACDLQKEQKRRWTREGLVQTCRLSEFEVFAEPSKCGTYWNIIGTSEVLNNSWTARMKEICNWTNLNLSQKAIRRNIENGRDSSSAIIVHLNILTAKEIVNKNWGWINRLPISPATWSGKVNSICKVQWVGRLLIQ